MTKDDIRSQFPFLETGLIYLNHAATSPMSNYVHQNVSGYMDVAHKGHVENFAKLLHTFTETRDLAGEFLGAPPDRLAFVQNTSVGLNLLAAGIPWEAGDRILLGEGEFPANVYPFLNQRRHGVEIDFVPQRNGRFDLADIEAAMTQRTRLVSLSWVQYLSGYTIDLKALYEMVSSKGALLCVDAIQGIGARRLNLAETPVDFMSSGVQKWQMGMHGMGVVYVSQKVQDLLQQAYLGWFSVKDFFDFSSIDHPPQDTAQRYEYGTYNTAGVYAYNGALKLFRDTGYAEVERMVRENANRVYDHARSAGYQILTPEDPAERSGIVTFKVDDADAVEKALNENGVTVSARVGHIRVSPHFYNTFDEIDKAMDIIATTLKR